MYLIEEGFFGNPEILSLHKLLVVAFKDFKAFQKQSGIRCSQTKFLPNFEAWLVLETLSQEILKSKLSAAILGATEVWKEHSGAHMGHKGYNGRVITLWLGDCMQRVVHHTVVAGREIGKWAHENGLWPEADDMLAPTAVAMSLSLKKET